MSETLPPSGDVRGRAGERMPGWFALWFGVIGGQAAWAIGLLVAYPTVAAVCGADAPRVVIHLVRWVAFAIAVTATSVAYRSWRRAQAATDSGVASETVTRTAFMGLGGLLLSAAGAFLVFVEDLATWVIDPCL